MSWRPIVASRGLIVVLLMSISLIITSSQPTNSISFLQMDASYGTNLEDEFDNEISPETIAEEMTRLRDEVRRLRDSMSPRRPGTADPDGAQPIRPDMQLINGMMLRRSARDDDEIGFAAVVLSRFSRGGKDEADRKKIRDRCCAALKHKFVLLDYSKLTDSATSGADLGAMVLAQTNALDELKDWAARYDVQYLLNMPEVPSFANPQNVAVAAKKDLLTEYRTFSRSRVIEYQEFVTVWMADVDTESSQWLLEVLKASTSKAILAEIHQEYMALPKSQRGGLTLFKFIMDIVHTNTTEHVELFRSFLNTYQLRDTADEEVPGSVSGFVAVVMMLAENDRPSNLVLLLLNGLESSNQKFNDTVSAQRGALNTPMYEQFKQNETELSLLLKFVTIAKRVYYSELQAKRWKPAKTSQHLFPALSNSSKLTAEAVLAKQPKSLPPGYVNHREKFVRWYLSRVCGICGGNHPDKHHDDPLFITRPIHQDKLTRPGTPKPKPKASPKFKPGKKEEFKRRVYQVAADCLEDFAASDDNAADLSDDFANLADNDAEFVEEEDFNEDTGDDNYDDSSMALAALALQGLSIN